MNLQECLDAIVSNFAGKQCGNGNFSIRCPAHNDNNASASVKLDHGKEMLLCHCFAGCSQKEIIAALEDKGLWPKNGTIEDAYDPSEFLKECSEIPHELPIPIQKYLDSRAISPDFPREFFRYHNNCPYYENKILAGYYPTLVGIVVDYRGKPVAVHKTHLTLDGKKADVREPKKMRGNVKGSSVWIGRPSDICAVTEGIETGLSVYQALKIPVLAALTQGGIRNLLVPGSVKELHIFCDKDESGIGYTSASTLALRLRK